MEDRAFDEEYASIPAFPSSRLQADNTLLRSLDEVLVKCWQFLLEGYQCHPPLPWVIATSDRESSS